MAISYPLNFPASRGPRRITFSADSVVAIQASPFTREQTVYAWPGDEWGAQVEIPPIQYLPDAAAWIAGFLLALNGQEGTFLMGPVDAHNYAGARGTWNGTAPKVYGAVAAGARTIPVKNLEAGVTWKLMDWLQVGSGSSARLHQVIKDGSASGSPADGLVEVWPAVRGALADGDAITLASPQGVWRLAQNQRSWSIDLAQTYGIGFNCMEAR